MRVFVRGSAVYGVNGGGFVMINPKRLFANDIGGCYWSQNAATYIDTGFPPLGAVGTLSTNSNSPFNYGAFGSGTPTSSTNQYRIVSAGVRSWYTGTELNLSGECLGFRHPDNDTVDNLSHNTLLGFDSVRRVLENSSRPVMETLWIPTKPSDLEFQSLADLVCPLGHARLGKAGETFAFEAYVLYEFIGRNVQGKSGSHADPSGFAAVLTAAQSEGDTWVGSARNAGASLINAATNGLKSLSGPVASALRVAGPYLGRAAISAAASYMGANNGGTIGLIGNTDPTANKVTVEETIDSADPNYGHYVKVYPPGPGGVAATANGTVIRVARLKSTSTSTSSSPSDPVVEAEVVEEPVCRYETPKSRPAIDPTVSDLEPLAVVAVPARPTLPAMIAQVRRLEGETLEAFVSRYNRTYGY